MCLLCLLPDARSGTSYRHQGSIIRRKGEQGPGQVRLPSGGTRAALRTLETQLSEEKAATIDILSLKTF